jgi:hypothetical protein
MRHSADINRKVRNIRCRHSHHDAAGGLCLKQIEFLTIPLLRFLRVRQQTRTIYLRSVRGSTLRYLKVFLFKAFCGGRVGDSSTVEQRTLTPSILVRIHVAQAVIEYLILYMLLSFQGAYFLRKSAALASATVTARKRRAQLAQLRSPGSGLSYYPLSSPSPL